MRILLSLALVFWSAGAACGAEVLGIPQGAPPSIDGLFTGPEWDGAATVEFTAAAADVRVRVHLKHDGESLFVGFEYPEYPAGELVIPEILIDPDNGKAAMWESDDWWFHVSAQDCEAQGAHDDYSRCGVSRAEWSGRPNFLPGSHSVPLDAIEIQISLDLAQLAPGRVFGLALTVAAWPSEARGYWPERATIENPSTWGEAVLLGEAGLTSLVEGAAFGHGESWSVDIADIDADGDLDLLVANASGPSTLWLNDGLAGLQNARVELASAQVARCTDIDGDGLVDLVLAEWGQGVFAWRNEGGGEFSERVQLSQLSGVVDLEAGDLDGDGDGDLFLARMEDDRVLMNDGAGSFRDAGMHLGTGFSAEVALGDIDLDGDLDALVDGWDDAGHVWTNDGLGGFTESQRLTSPEWHVNGLELGDLDGDGDLDVVLVSSLLDPHEIWLNDGAGHFQDSGVRLDAPDGYDAALGDLDGDGDLDLALAVAGDPLLGLAVWMNEGDAFVRTDVPSYRGLARDLVLGDLDNDGDLDIVGGYVRYARRFYPWPNKIWLNGP